MGETMAAKLLVCSFTNNAPSGFPDLRTVQPEMVPRTVESRLQEDGPKKLKTRYQQ